MRFARDTAAARESPQLSDGSLDSRLGGGWGALLDAAESA